MEKYREENQEHYTQLHQGESKKYVGPFVYEQEVQQQFLINNQDTIKQQYVAGLSPSQIQANIEEECDMEIPKHMIKSLIKESDPFESGFDEDSEDFEAASNNHHKNVFTPAPFEELKTNEGKILIDINNIDPQEAVDMFSKTIEYLKADASITHYINNNGFDNISRDKILEDIQEIDVEKLDMSIEKLLQNSFLNENEERLKKLYKLKEMSLLVNEAIAANRLQKKLDKALSKYAQIQNNLSEAKKQINLFEQQLEAINSTQKEDEIKALQEALTQEQTYSKEKAQELEELKNELEALKEQIQTEAQLHEEPASQEQNEEQEDETQIVSVNDNANEIVLLQEQLNEKVQYISELEALKKELEERINALNEEIEQTKENNEIDTENYKEQIQTQADEILTLNDKLSSSQRTQATQEEVIEQLEKQIAELKEQINDAPLNPALNQPKPYETQMENSISEEEPAPQKKKKNIFLIMGVSFVGILAFIFIVMTFVNMFSDDAPVVPAASKMQNPNLTQTQASSNPTTTQDTLTQVQAAQAAQAAALKLAQEKEQAAATQYNQNTPLSYVDFRQLNFKFIDNETITIEGKTVRKSEIANGYMLLRIYQNRLFFQDPKTNEQFLIELKN